MMSTFSLGIFTFHVYGLIMGFSVLVGIAVSEKILIYLFPKGEISKKQLENSFWWVLLTGFLGARLYHVWDYWDYYSHYPREILAVWHGGLGIYGALVGGMGGAFLYGFWHHKTYKENVFGGIVDAFSVGLPLAQALGRWGNFFNQELYGKPTDLPWKLFIDTNNRLPEYAHVSYYHPLFLYESIWNVLGFCLLYGLARRRMLLPGKGNYLLTYLFWYALGRSVLEYFRIEPWTVGGLPVATLLGVVIIMITLAGYFYRKSKHEWQVLAD